MVAGEILWEWLGLIWIMTLTTPTFRRMHGGWIIRLETMEECARLTLALTIGLICYGRRPIRPGPVWAHYVGWGLAECDLLLWGWHSSPWS